MSEALSEALPLAQTADFDIAPVDVNVGGVTSADAAKIVARRQLPLLFLSGYKSTGLAARFCDSSSGPK